MQGSERFEYRVGIDVGSKTLVVAVVNQSGPVQFKEFPNTSAGHLELVQWLAEVCSFGPGNIVRVAMEATGKYSVDLAFTLSSAAGLQVDVLNPEKSLNFRKDRVRSKTDKSDARALADWCLEDRFRVWTPPSPEAYELRDRVRLDWALVKICTRLKNQLHATHSSSKTPVCVPQALQTILDFLEERAAIEIKSVNAAVRGNKDWALKFDLLQTIPGIAAKSALAILGELVVLQPHTSARALIAYSGLDPQNSKSGNAEHEAKISRGGSVHLRRALYMPAVTAIRCNSYFKRFFKKLVKRGKHRNVAIIAAERKMLQGIYGMLKTGTRFNGKKLFGKTVGKTSQPAQKKSSS